MEEGARNNKVAEKKGNIKKDEEKRKRRIGDLAGDVCKNKSEGDNVLLNSLRLLLV